MPMLENAHALIVGIANYQKITPLPATVLKDAQDIYNLLVSPNYGGYVPDNVQLLLDSQATQANLREALSSIAQKSNADSSVVIYISSHGGHEDFGPHAGEYLLPVDADCTSGASLAQTAIAGSDFTDALRAIPARKLVVIFDCCHAGGIGQPKDADAPVLKGGLSDSYYDQLKQGTGRAILASSLSTESSYVIPGAENSLFTQHLLAGLQGGIASEDGLIHIFDLFEYVQPKVTSDQPNQHPIFKAELEENFPVALYLGGQKGVIPKVEAGFRYVKPIKLPRRSPFFVGRKEQLEQVCQDLIASQVLQIRGLGGIGKTALAIEAGHKIKDSFPNGVVWLFAPDYNTIELFLNKLATLFEIEIAHQTALEAKKEAIQKALAQKKALLILDNVEDVNMAEDMISILPSFSVLITSRPNIPILKRIVCRNLDVLPWQESIQLFVRISEINLSSSEKKQKLKPLCEDILGNFPLAIELAAKLLRFEFSNNLDSLSKRLKDSLNDLDDMPLIDNRKVMASFTSTYEILTKTEGKLFNLLGTFPARTFSFDAIKAVSGNIGMADTEIESALHKKFVALSLVNFEKGRYSLHPLLKSFAISRLTSIEPYKTMIRYFAEYAQKNANNFDALETERVNLFGAIDWSYENNEYEFVVELVETLVAKRRFFSFLSQRGYWEQAILRLSQELEAIKHLPGKHTSRIYLSLGFFHYLLGNHDDGREANQLAIEKLKKELAANNSEEEVKNNTRRLIIAYWQSGYIEDDEDNYDKALEYYENSLKLAETSYPDFVLNSRKLVGVVKYHQGNYQKAREYMEKSLEEAKECDQIQSSSQTRGDVGTCQRRLAAVLRKQALLNHDEEQRNSLLARSRQLLNECLELEDSERSHARAWRQLGMLEQAAGDIDEANKYFNQSLKSFRKNNNKKGIASTLYNLGTILEYRGDLKGAEKHYNDSLELGVPLQVRFGIALNLRQLGSIKHKYGNHKEAVELITKAVNILKEIKSPYLQETLEQLERVKADMGTG
jgi:tetratricopeptide (TPR) repeat protein